MSTQETTTQAVKNSAVISTFNALGFASALLIDILIAAHFGLSRETDAFFIAFTIPQLIASILLVAFNVVLVPIFTKVLIEEGHPGLWRISSNMANLGLAGMSVLGIIGSLSAPVLIRILGAGLDQPTQQLAISLGSWLFLMVIPLGAVEVFKAILNSMRSFAFPAATISVRNGVTVLIVVAFSRSLGIGALVVGYVLGAWCQLVFLGFALLTRGFKYHLVFDWREPQTADALRKLRHPLAGAILGQSNILLERFLASFLPVGLVSALVYARRMLRAVSSIFLGSISTAFLPRLSAQTTQDSLSQFKRSTVLALKLTFVISAPMTAGIIALSVPLVTLFFQRGAFDQSAVDITAVLLSLYILGVPAVAVLQIFRAAFYAFGDTKTPFFIRFIMLGLNVVLDLMLFFVLEAAGLALGLTLAETIATALAFWFLYRRIGSLGPEVTGFTVKVGLASILMGGLLFGLLRAVPLGNLGLSDPLDSMFSIVVGVILGGGVYAGLLLLFRVQEIRQIISIGKLQFTPHKAGKQPH